MNYYTDVLKKYAVFKGRARRKEYWMFVLFNFIFSIVASILDGILGTGKGLTMSSGGGGNGIISSLYSLALILPSIAVGVRRLHDTDRSGWWILLPVASFPLFLLCFYNLLVGLIVAFVGMLAGTIAVLVFYCLEGTPGENKYGPNPKAMPATGEPEVTPEVNPNQA